MGLVNLASVNFAGNITSHNFYDNASVWILDTGASDHICCDRNAFASFIDVVVPSVSLPSAQNVIVKFVGPFNEEASTTW
ncbi:hypothetical protein L6164_023676 [Bauhinia variegata]|uniref:Uncharacterized protein n=1 Tax=Bauhinia variegata TaxID=167791 RepID=A0ACB9MJF3_BAUVA|nr:hypothetical protein L6164_023676 [Bauhinia variegata]